jgi:hypothetical protein
MVAEVFAGISAIKSAFDIAKGLKDIDDAARRNAAIIELQEKILTAQQAQSELIEKIRELEHKVAVFENWETEKQRYALTDFGGGTFALVLKPDKANGEPVHRLCPTCYEKGQKSILQFEFVSSLSGREKWKCHACNSEFEFGPRQPPQNRSARAVMR